MFSFFVIYDLFFYRSSPMGTTIKLDQNIKVSETSEKPVQKETKNDDRYNFSKININTADANELLLNLKGIGQAKAERIIEYRQKYGNFSDIQEIRNVKGIGDKIFEKIKDLITV